MSPGPVDSEFEMEAADELITRAREEITSFKNDDLFTNTFPDGAEDNCAESVGQYLHKAYRPTTMRQITDENPTEARLCFASSPDPTVLSPRGLCSSPPALREKGLAKLVNHSDWIAAPLIVLKPPPTMF